MDKFQKVLKLAHNPKYFHKLADLIEDLNDKEYHSAMGPNRPLIPFYSTRIIYGKKVRYRTIQVVSNLQLAKIERNTIVDTLRSINFKRINNWDKYITIGFMEEVLRLNSRKNIPESLNEDSYLKDIAFRYSIPVNKVRSTMSILITNIKRGYDKFGLLDYFDWFELFQYKYKDNEEQLKQDFEDNKLNEKEEEIYRQIYNI